MSGKVLICVPTYNEAGNIASLIKNIFKYLDSCHILVIDDNSPDGTGSLVKNHPRFGGSLFLLERDEKNGLGAAYLAGFAWGIARHFTYIFQCDGDLSHNPKYLQSFLGELESGADLVIGSRGVSGGEVRNWGLLRRWLSSLGCLYGKIVLGVNIKDLTGGYNAHRASCLKRLLSFDPVLSNGYVFQIEMKYRAVLNGARVVEKPIIFENREKGESKINFKIIFEAIWLVVFIRVKYLKKRKLFCKP